VAYVVVTLLLVMRILVKWIKDTIILKIIVAKANAF